MITKQFNLFVNGKEKIDVYVDVVNTPEEHKWRLRYRFHETPWEKYYEGVLILDAKHLKIGYATAYWEGSLPVETPFLIQPMAPVDDVSLYPPIDLGASFDKLKKQI